MRNLIQRFLRDTGGAITTEFVVVAGALVGLSIASVAAVQLGATNMAGNYDMGATRGAGGVLCMFSNANDCAPGATDTSTGGGGTTVDTGGTTDGGTKSTDSYTMLYLTQSDADRLANELRLYSADQVMSFIRSTDADFYSAMNGGDPQKVAYLLDTYSLGVQVLTERYGYDADAATALDAFTRALEYYQANLR